MATDLSHEIAAFLKQRGQLLKDFGNVWVVFVGGDCKGHFGEFDAAARFALSAFPEAAFLIRRTTDPDAQIPMVVIGG